MKKSLFFLLTLCMCLPILLSCDEKDRPGEIYGVMWFDEWDEEDTWGRTTHYENWFLFNKNGTGVEIWADDSEGYVYAEAYNFEWEWKDRSRTAVLLFYADDMPGDYAEFKIEKLYTNLLTGYLEGQYVEFRAR